MPAWPGWLPDLTEDAVQRLVDVAETSVWPAVVTAVVAQVDAGLGVPLLPETLLALAALDAADPAAADPDRDRPARRRLDVLVLDLVGRARQNPARDPTALRVAGWRLAG